MTQDPEDSMDQLLAQSWTNLAMSLRNLSSQVRQDVRENRRERNTEKARLRKDKEQARHALNQWTMRNRDRLNAGFEQTLRATVLDPRFLAEPKPSDLDLLKAWNVAEYLKRNGDPGFMGEVMNAKRILQGEWSARHPDDHGIEAEADRIDNNVTIYYHRDSEEMQRTVESLRKGGVTNIDMIPLDERDYRRQYGDKATFHVDSRMTGAWDGWDRQQIIQAVLASPLSGNNTQAIGERVAMLQDVRLPETEGADNTAVGDEPSAVSEEGAFESQDAAPVPAPAPEEAAKARESTRAAGRSDDPAPTYSAGPEGVSVTGAVRDDADRQPTPYDGLDMDAPVDPVEPDDWYGPDMFGEYSPAQEVAIAAGNGLATAMPAAPVPVARPEYGPPATQ